MPRPAPRPAAPFTLLGAAALWAAAAAGCADDYDQSSPEAVVQSAKLMVENGDAQQLQRLIYAETPEMRTLLEQIGVLLQSLQDLGHEVQRAFPKEIEQLKADAAEAAKDGQATGFLSRMTGMTGGQRGRRGRDPSQQRQSFDLAMKELFADPYGWLARTADRVTTESLGDDMAAVLVDGKPVLPPLGLVLREDGGKWYLVLPTSVPGVSEVMPRTPEGYDVLGSLIEVFDNTLVDLRKDVREGKAKSLNELADIAGEKAFLPAALAFIAYEKAREEARKSGAK